MAVFRLESLASGGKIVLNKPDTIGEVYDVVCIDKDGNVTVEQHGYAQGSCREAARYLEARMGRVSDRRDKDDPGGGSYQEVR
jgi:hypothetical protein